MLFLVGFEECLLLCGGKLKLNFIDKVVFFVFDKVGVGWGVVEFEVNVDWLGYVFLGVWLCKFGLGWDDLWREIIEKRKFWFVEK